MTTVFLSGKQSKRGKNPVIRRAEIKWHSWNKHFWGQKVGEQTLFGDKNFKPTVQKPSLELRNRKGINCRKLLFSIQVFFN